MHTLNKKESVLLLVGDLVVFVFALWCALLLRTGEVPDRAILEMHSVPFAILFITWVTFFFIAGLYDMHATRLKSHILNLLLGAQLTNSVIAIAFFYFIPYFGITPKIVLFIQLTLSLLYVVLWRIYGEPIFGLTKRERAMLIGTKAGMATLMEKVNRNSHYYLEFVAFIDLDQTVRHEFKKEFLEKLHSSRTTTIALDLRNEAIAPILPELYGLMFENVRFISVQKLYEEVFGRIPLALLDHNWILENISLAPRFVYDMLKRMMDIVFSLTLIIITLPLLPFVALAIKLDDGGPIFLVQERIGKGTKIVRIWKIRSMSSPTSDQGKWVTEDDTRITRVGKFLRRSRIDELPQLWNVLGGDLSVIGPRPDICDLGKQLATTISYYNIRSTIKPGLSGWAQVNQEKPPQSLEETRRRLEYDLYYIKHRSFILDVNIALRTLKTLVMRGGV
jgi:exopolysaccharide biosynthesis polyprenyl glycosylphosphotransferase